MQDIRKTSMKQEKRVAKELGGRTTPASGAIDNFKGDVRANKYLVECKITGKPFYSLTMTVWEKIYHEAMSDGFRVPVMCIDVGDGLYTFAVVEDNTVDTDVLTSIVQGYENNTKVLVEAEKVKSFRVGYRPHECTSVKLVDGKEHIRGFKGKQFDPDINFTVMPWSDFVANMDNLVG